MRIVFRLALVVYLLTVAYFGFRPFKPIPGRQYPHVPAATHGVVGAGAALEDAKGGRQIRNALMATGQMSLEVELKTASLEQGGPARILSFSCNAMSRNFTLGQSGHGLAFRLRTSETDNNGMMPSLLVPKVFEEDAFQHIVLVYDGARVRLFVDGVQRPESAKLQGNFSNWGKNHLFTVGDEPSGVKPWAGTIRRFRIYDRALDAGRVAELHAGKSVAGVIYAFPEAGTMRPLHYRNLFIFSDPIFNPGDCLANIMAFLPLAPLLWLAFPRWFRKHWSIVVWPVLAGLLISATIETMQHGLMGRVPTLLDLVYNGFGALVGCSLLGLGLKLGRFSGMMSQR